MSFILLELWQFQIVICLAERTCFSRFLPFLLHVMANQERCLSISSILYLTTHWWPLGMVNCAPKSEVFNDLLSHFFCLITPQLVIREWARMLTKTQLHSSSSPAFLSFQMTFQDPLKKMKPPTTKTISKMLKRKALRRHWKIKRPPKLMGVVGVSDIRQHMSSQNL